MTFPEILLFPFAISGHIGIWCGVFNQLHATNLPRWIGKSVEKLIYVIVAALLILLCFRAAGKFDASNILLNAYICLCVVAFAFVLFRWFYRSFAEPVPRQVISEKRRMVDVGRQITSTKLHGLQARMLSLIPGNQSFKLSIEHRVFELERWPAKMDGMVIAHLSDLHFTGKICREYFEKVVDECNACQPDFVFITGDIVDKVECLDWLPATLGRLKSKYGKYYVLGNHDLRVKDEPRLRRAIESAGFNRAVADWTPLNFNGATFYLAGDELPWFPGAEALTNAPEPSILLAHSPDRVFDSSRRGVDLLLAGHCHGGQIRIPIIGPIISPSKYGVRFASGTFRIGGTLMHVSRGISGDDPVRLNCPPELSLVEVRSRKDGSTFQQTGRNHDLALQETLGE